MSTESRLRGVAVVFVVAMTTNLLTRIGWQEALTVNLSVRRSSNWFALGFGSAIVAGLCERGFDRPTVTFAAIVVPAISALTVGFVLGGVFRAFVALPFERVSAEVLGVARRRQDRRVAGAEGGGSHRCASMRRVEHQVRGRPGSMRSMPPESSTGGEPSA